MKSRVEFRLPVGSKASMKREGSHAAIDDSPSKLECVYTWDDLCSFELPHTASTSLIIKVEEHLIAFQIMDLIVRVRVLIDFPNGTTDTAVVFPMSTFLSALSLMMSGRKIQAIKELRITNGKPNGIGLREALRTYETLVEELDIQGARP